MCTPLPTSSCAHLADDANDRRSGNGRFTTLSPLTVAARVIGRATRICVAFAVAAPVADLFRAIALALKPAPT
ncbi:MAG: hypothetical protein EDM03_09110 [Porphyrobacter sp. IPPAS B-1204]|nr:MAG: hypothetical protein EDM03_09110 [Porphyrobacter sp. IPPAS B-1204]